MDPPAGFEWNEAMENVEEDLTPRPYQSQVLDVALNQNTIVFLPTGSGKTFIAIMLIKRLATFIQQKFSCGGKRTFFLVNTVALVEQQKNFIHRHACLSVGGYSGDMNVDYWKKEKWREELDKHQVLVMTAQILLDILNHSYLQLSDINLIVFDECHHAVNQHCMSKIMTHFKSYPVEEHPRILGLTATLLNGTVKFHRVPETVTTLEETFLSKIATVQNVNEVENFSTSPNEIHIPFDEPSTIEVYSQVKWHVDQLSTFVQNYAFDEDNVTAPEVPGAVLLKNKSLGKKIANKLQDVLLHLHDLGLYGGSISALKLIMLLERRRAKAETSDSVMIYATIITTLIMIRTMLENEMKEYSEEIRICKFSSPKVLSLLEILKKYQPQDGRGIVFVERRLTAKVLFHVLRAASENLEGLNFIRSDFIVGFQNNPLKFTREGQLEKKWHREAVERFRKGETNVIVASEVLEEGIDIPDCKLVLKFDAPRSFRSYIQSKGRARHKNSHFVVLIPKVNRLKLAEDLREYQNIENFLKSILSGSRMPSSDEHYLNDEEEDNEMYSVGDGARVTLNSAIPLVNRYCTMLPHDTYTSLVPLWYFKGNALHPPYQCILHLPVNSPVKESFMGKKCPNKKLAKQSAAFRACKALHQAGELNDNLLPEGHHSEDFICEEEIFEIYHSAAKDDMMEQPGTKKCQRLYEKQVPKDLSDCMPVEGIELYLHIILMIPVYDEPLLENTRKHAFFQLLKSEKCFAILSSNKLPQLCDFPVFLNVGRIAVSVAVNYSVIHLRNDQIKKLRQFHKMLFFDLLKLHKSYLVTNIKTTEHNYLVVPVTKNGKEIYEIDWEVVHNNNRLPNFKQPTTAERLGNDDCDWMTFEHSLVVPWYRGLPPDQVYVVTKVCEDRSPLSPFPTSSSIAFSTYEEYFYKKYSLVINNSSQPLFEVRAITTRLNCLKPRLSHGTGRNKRQELNDDFEEHLVPELCIPIDFPSALWLKAVCIPSCLHRITHLLLAEELRVEIAESLRLSPLAGGTWDVLPIDPDCISEDIDGSKHSTSQLNVKGRANTHLDAKKNTLDYEGEPVDIDRERLEDVTLWDILYYDEFINKPADSVDDQSLVTENEEENFIYILEDVPVPKMSLLEEKKGLQLSKILQALICARSNDALNMERLETLGDSFLKFATSLFLFLQYPKLHEGILTQAKGKIVGNRNLFYCGKHRKIVGKIKVHEFNPKSDWIPPTYCIPQELKESLLKHELCPSILFEMIFPREEQESGILSSASLSNWNKIVNESDRKYSPSPTESLMGVQSVSDKTVADCIEALIGAYLEGYGIEGAMKVLGWFNILPPHLADPAHLLGSISFSPYLSDDTENEVKLHHFLNESMIKKIESRINYVFKNKGFLLQALTHASYSQNRLTDCYQRLEFLGDAVLDFLVTCHIYEYCGKLSPGDLTDLRSALVNNITFGSLAVRYDFHKFCLYDSPKLFEKIDSFVNFQEKQGHKINEEVLMLHDENVASPLIGESVDVPKVLGDLFESLAGAIFLDSGKDLSTVWRVYYRLMKNEIDCFSKSIPKQPVRMLYEQCNPPPVFSATHVIPDVNKVMVELEIFFKDEKRRYYGVGGNRAEAKRTAAKIALRNFK